MRAAARGVVDFSRFDPFDRAWWSRLYWLLDEIESEDLTRLVGARHAQHLAGVGHYTEQWPKAAELLKDLSALLRPWTDRRNGPRPGDVEAMRAELIRRVGDPKDPKTQERIARTVQYLKDLVKPAAKPAPAVKTKSSKTVWVRPPGGVLP